MDDNSKSHDSGDRHYLLHVDGQGIPSIQPLKDDAFAVAVAALEQLKEAKGTNGIQQALRAVDSDLLLVRESELCLSLYNSRVFGVVRDA